jgi:hypothetical protein
VRERSEGRRARGAPAGSGRDPADGWSRRAAVAAATIVAVATIQVVTALAAVPASGATTAAGRPSVAPARTAPPVVPDEAGWILAAQLPNGAIASHTDRTFVNPYLAGYAAVGLATATRMSGDRTYAAAAWRWAAWYGSAMGANGYVTDYDITPGGLVSTGTYDSTDAYSGMFLVAVDATFNASPDAARLRELAPKVAQAVGAIRSTQRADGLTGAKPDWMVAYLMNEAEAYAGLRAAGRLARTLGDRTLARSADAAADALSAGVERSWNAGAGAFDWAVHPSGDRVATNWAQLYPDALSQLWAVGYGLVRGPLATAVTTRFEQSHPDAADPTAPDLVDGAVRPGGYWPGAGLSLATVDRTAPARFLAGTRAAAVATGRAWPYSVQTAAQSIQLAAAAR